MTTEESEDARMRTLFGDVSRPPMGDEDFVQAVMGRVREERLFQATRRNAVGLGAMAVLVGALWPFKTAIYAAMTAPMLKLAPSIPALGAGATGLVIAAVVSVAALAYTERG